MKRAASIVLLLMVVFCTLCPVISYATPGDPTPSPTPTSSSDPGVWDKIKDGFGGLTNGISGVVDSITNLPDRIGKWFSESLVKGIRNMLLTNINVYLEGFQHLLKKDDTIFTNTVMIKISSFLKPMAMSLVALFFVMDFCKRTIYFETMTMEGVTKPLLKLALGKIVVDNTHALLGIIIKINSYIVTYVTDTIMGDNWGTIFDVGTSFDKSYNAVGNTASEQLGAVGFFVLVAVLLLVCAILIYVTLMLRYVKLLVLTTVGYLYFATIASDVTNDVFISYIKSYIAVALQTTFMAIGIAFFSSSINSYLSGSALGAIGTFLESCVLICAMAVYIIRTPDEIRNTLGGAGGTNFNIAGWAMLFRGGF